MRDLSSFVLKFPLFLWFHYIYQSWFTLSHEAGAASPHGWGEEWERVVSTTLSPQLLLTAALSRAGGWRGCRTLFWFLLHDCIVASVCPCFPQCFDLQEAVWSGPKQHIYGSIALTQAWEMHHGSVSHQPWGKSSSACVVLPHPHLGGKFQLPQMLVRTGMLFTLLAWAWLGHS